MKEWIISTKGWRIIGAIVGCSFGCSLGLNIYQDNQYSSIWKAGYNSGSEKGYKEGRKSNFASLKKLDSFNKINTGLKEDTVVEK